MSIDFHAIAITQDQYQKYKDTSKLKALWQTYYLEGEDDRELALKLADDSVSDYLDPEDATRLKKDLKEVITAGEWHSDKLYLPKQFHNLDESLAELKDEYPILSWSVYEGEPTSLGNEYSIIRNPQLSEVANLLEKVRFGDGDDWEIESIEEIRQELATFYRSAADHNWVVIRCYA